MSEDDDRPGARLFPKLLVVALVVGLAAWFVLHPRQRARGPAGSAPAFVDLVAPRGELDAAPGRFEWKPVAGAARYRVKIEDADAVWPLFVRSTEVPSLVLEPGEAEALRPERVHLWEVEALDAGGAVIASGGTRFRVRPAP